MIKKIIRGMGLLSLCCMAFVMSVRAADNPPVSLEKDSDGVKVELFKEAIGDEVHTLHLTIDVDVEKGNLSKDEISFHWANTDDNVYKTQFSEAKDSGKLTLDIYTSAKQDLFPSESDVLTVGVVKLTPAKGSVTAKVKVESWETVNKVQEKMGEDKVEYSPVEITAGKKSGGSSNNSNNNNNDNSSNSNTNNNQTAPNTNNANTNNTNNNLDLNNSITQAVIDNDTVQDSATSQNKNSQSSANRNTQKKDSSSNQAAVTGEVEITGTEVLEPEEVETERETLAEVETVSTEAAENVSEPSQADAATAVTTPQESSGMGLGIKVLLGIIIVAVVAAGAVFAVRFSGKKKE